MKTTVMLTLVIGLLSASQPAQATALHVEDVLIQLIEEVHVPARHAGVLAEVRVREGQPVEAGTLLAKMEDRDVRIDKDRTLLELEIAEKNSKNDVRVRLAGKKLELAEAELRRAMESIETYSKSISQSEIDRSRLTVQQAVLEVEQADHEREIAQITRQLKLTELRAAEHQLELRQIASPINGVVAEVNAQQGEWVMPGQRVARILRMDRLRAQGFIAAEQLEGDLTERSVTIRVQTAAEKPRSIPGQIVYVSAEVDPVDGQVLVWAEFDNRDGSVRPGMRAQMSIHEQDRSRPVADIHPVH